MKRTHLALLVIITTFGALLRLWNLGGESFWVDEGWSAYMGHVAQWSAWQMNEHPPLFYALVAVWMRITDTDAWLRVLPAIFGIAVIPVVFFIGRRLFDANTGFVAAGFMALTAFHVRYSRDLTAYSLEVLLFACALLAIAYVAVADDRRAGLRAWIAYVAAATPLAWSQGLAPFYVGIVGILLPLLRLDFFSAGLWKPWLVAHGVVVLCFLPWLSTYIVRAQSIAGDFWIPRPDIWAPWRQVFQFTVGSIPSIQDRLGAGPGAWIWGVPIYLVLATVIWRGLAQRNRPVIALSAALILPIATIYLVSIFIRPIMVTRQMIPTIVPLVLLLAVGCNRLFTSRLGRIAALAGIGGLLLLSSVFHLRYMQKEDWRGATQFLSQRIKPDDTIVFNTYGAFHGYLMGRYDPQANLADNRMVFLHPVLRKCQGEVKSCLDQAIFSSNLGGAYWIVESHERYLPHAEIVAQWLDARFIKSDLQQRIGVKIWMGTRSTISMP